ncbi:hypothetical protein MBLNU459_g6253t1 [Dothideomycetes sp. NU459]
MRAALRLLAAVPPQRFLEAGAPTGLAGLVTHATPRSALMYIYHTTLQKLATLPESSVYRQSTEALTRHRLQIVEATKPDGLDAWQQRVSALVEQHPDAFRKVPALADKAQFNYIYKDHASQAMDTEAWDADASLQKPEPEGPRSVTERAGQLAALSRDTGAESAKIPRLEPEPPLTADQISDMEQQIGAGLIEEVIQVAEGEAKLVDTMIESKVWEDLAVKPTEGQWAYYERDRHTPTTQAP